MFYILVDDILKARFFLSFAKFDDVVFITNKVSCYFYLKFGSKRKVIFLWANNSHEMMVDNIPLEKTISVLNGRQTIDKAIQNYQQVYKSLLNKFKSSINAQDTLVLFNGNHASAIATADFFRKHKATTLYAEISNLPGKMIFDPEGVNAQSILFKSPEILDTLPEITEAEHYAWVEEYIGYKKKPIPQAKINIGVYTVIAFEDVLSRFTPFLIREDSLAFNKKVSMFLDKYKSKKILASSITADLNCQYTFYPTQVTSDTQLRINSDVDNISAIEKIIKAEPGNKIFVKIHPAESDIATINYFHDLASRGLVTLVKNNTIDLIINANKVYTINSTVGLESLILGADLEILGRAIYSNFNASRLKKYVHHYLINLDYFGENNVTSSHREKMKKLTGL